MGLSLARIELMYAAYRLAFLGVPSVDPVGALALQQQGAVLVDVRTDPERAVSMLPGAISQAELEAAPDRYRGRVLVVYCTIGARSGQYAKALQQQGREVYNLKGSILAWTHHGGALVTPEGEPTRRVHVYGETWNLVAEGYQAVW